MNKLVKGSIAGAAGIALLLGGAGTFALWNDSTTVTAKSITAGHLRLDASTAGVWTVNGTPINPTTYKVIPGTTLKFTQSLSVNAQGDGLKASLTYSGLTAGGGLSPYVGTPTLAIKYQGQPVNGNTVAIVDGESTMQAELSVTFNANNEDGMDEQLTLTDLTFNLAQTL